MKRSELGRFLRRAERSVALLDRCRPLNGAAELERLREAWRAGRKPAAAFRYRTPPDLRDLRAGLDTVVTVCQPLGAWAALYAERAVELGLEAAAAEAVGTRAFGALAAARYPLDAGAHGQEALAWANAWCSARSECSSEPACHVSDDERDPGSLLAVLRRAVGERRLPFRVEVAKDLVSTAATGDRAILVRSGVRLRQRDVTRIALHELEGHVMPRVRAMSERFGLYAVGTAQASDDEEGRALLIEERARELDAARRAELGWRHLAALAMRSGADFVDSVELLFGQGAELDSALEVSARVHRGGGLGRELVYLPALARVRAGLVAEPELEAYLERGRVSIAAARRLRALGEPPEPRERVQPITSA